jgi:hypothetical protein
MLPEIKNKGFAYPLVFVKPNILVLANARRLDRTMYPANAADCPGVVIDDFRMPTSECYQLLSNCRPDNTKGIAGSLDLNHLAARIEYSCGYLESPADPTWNRVF